MSTVMIAAEQMEISKPALALVNAQMSPKAAVSALMAADLSPDALKLLARSLPKRYAVGWVCQCVRGQALSIEDKAGASLAEKWVREPNEENRRAAFEFAQAGGYKSLGAWIAATAGWSGGSLGPANLEKPILPPEFLTARAVAASITLLAALVAEQFKERRTTFMHSALELLSAEAKH